MKKSLIVFVLVLIIVVFGVIYIFIPREIQVDKLVLVSITPSAARRTITDEKTWKNWWPGDSNRPGKFNFNFQQSNFSITEELYNGFQIEIANGKDTLKSLLHLIPIPKNIDSTAIQWAASIETSSNPIRRVQQYFTARRIRSDVDSLLSALAAFLDKQENVYGMKIERQVVSDTLLVYKQFDFTHSPSTTDVYGMINDLQTKIRKVGIHQTHYPMLNIIKLDSSKFRAMVAIPVDKEIETHDSLLYIRMVRGWILVSEIRGGQYTIQKAMEQMGNFVSDNARVSVAMPFESLVTDRFNQPDTSQWITRIYFPVVL